MRIIRTIQNTIVYESTLATLAAVSVLLLIYEYAGTPSPGRLRLIHATDLAIACIFLTDFLLGCAMSANPVKYARNNWLNFASSIPITHAVYRSLRILRIVRAMRVIRLLALTSNTARLKTAFQKHGKKLNKAENNHHISQHH